MKRLVAAATAISAVLLVSPASARAMSSRVEVPVPSSSPITNVAESQVSVYVPLPSSAGPHPAACDWLSYLRWRSVDGPSDPLRADRVLVAQPGIFEGAAAFDSVARDTVARAAAQGRHVEFWAISRRSNCLVDRTGEQAALAARNPGLALDYYYHHLPVDGRTFAGYVTSDQAGWLAHVGVAQTVRDEYDLITSQLPDASFRQHNLLCGGHSLGGIITGYLADWDFDGQPGYQLCSAWFALDSIVSPHPPGLENAMPPSMLPASGAQLPAILSLPVLINPETENLLGIAGLYADLDPGGPSPLTAQAPDNTNVDTTMRLLFARDYAHFLTGTPDPRRFALTNAAVLGALIDNNSEPLAFLQASLGFFKGPGLADKNFPVPNTALTIPALSFLKNLIGTDPKAVPTQTGPLYTWLDYDQIGTPADPGVRDAAGDLFTTRAQEVTDTAELARSFAEAPLDFTEWYFPTKLIADMYAPDADMTSHLTHPDGVATHPTLQIKAGSGLDFGGGTLPNTTVVIAPYYHHLDVLTASPTQNNGEPEIVSTRLTQFALNGPGS